MSGRLRLFAALVLAVTVAICAGAAHTSLGVGAYTQDFDTLASAGESNTLPAGWALDELELGLSWPEHGWLVLLALTSQVVGWLFIAYALPRVQAALTSVVLTLQPALSVVLGVILLDEAPSSVQLTGVLVILSGVLLATTGRRREAAARPAEAAARVS